MNTKKENQLIETYKGVEIWNDNSNPEHPIASKEYGIPILDVMECGHKSIEAAKEYIDRTRKPN